MDLQHANNLIDKHLRPQTFPVAIRLAGSEDAGPGKFKQPKKDFGVTMPVCQGVSLSRRYGWTLAMSQEDMLCPLGSLTLGFVPPKQKFLDGEFNIPFWLPDKQTRAKVAQNISKLEYNKYSRIFIAPLHKADFEPQVIIFYGNPAQLSRLVQSNVYANGKPLTSSQSGGFACGGEITVPFLTDECQMIITGGGDRAIAQTQDHEGAFSIPVSRLEGIVNGLEATHKAGMRYPTTSFLTYQAQFPPVFGELMSYLEESRE